MQHYLPELECFSSDIDQAKKLIVLSRSVLSQWLSQQTDFIKKQIAAQNFDAAPGSQSYLLNQQGELISILIGVCEKPNIHALGHLPFSLEEDQVYQIEDPEGILAGIDYRLGWAKGAYHFVRYKKPLRKSAKLWVAQSSEQQRTEALAKATYLTRDLINTPAEDMAPSDLAEVAKELAKKYGAKLKVIHDKDLLKENYPTIYTVGRAAEKRPCLIDLRWGDPKTARKKITLIGKGVTFDTGGLDLKSHQAMLPMKKDKAGAASVFGLGLAIMEMKLPVSLRILVPAVENSIGGNAYRPSDIITTRSGKTVEVGDTDYEGRLILCDAISEAVTELPDLMVDFTTLTLEARVAVGTDISAFFCNNDAIASGLMQAAKQEQDPAWQLPLYQPYTSLLSTDIADINNAPTNMYSGVLLAGATTAALFLQSFIPDHLPWIHFDVMGVNLSSTPGRPRGGEAMGVRATYALIEKLIQ